MTTPSSVAWWNCGAQGPLYLAIIVFTASIVVPMLKFLALGMLLLSSHRGSDWARLQRAKLFRLVELIGYWSMLDVLVVALVAALVQFRGLSTIEPRLGILFFGLVVSDDVGRHEFRSPAHLGRRG